MSSSSNSNNKSSISSSSPSSPSSPSSISTVATEPVVIDDYHDDDYDYDAVVKKTTTTKINVLGLFLVVVPPMLGGFLYGFDIGATSFVLFMLLNDDDGIPPSENESSESCNNWWQISNADAEEDHHQLSSTRQGLIVSGMSLGALIGSHIVLVYLSSNNFVGRRTELRLSSMFYFVGSCLNVSSGTILAEQQFWGFWCLFFGRILYGIGVGFVMHGAPAYLAEMSPHEIRGSIVSFKETIIVGGIVVGYIVGDYITTMTMMTEQEKISGFHRFQWTDLYGLCGLMSIPMFVLTYFVPRSMRWLLLHGRTEEAYESMKFVYRGDITDEYKQLVAATTTTTVTTASRTNYNRQKHNSCTTKIIQDEPSLFDARDRKAIFASIGLIIFQQLSGQPSVLSYATVLFKAGGWSGNATVVSSVLMMITSAITVGLVERLGRKFLLSTGCVIMMVSLFVLSESFWDWDEDEINENVVAVSSSNSSDQNLVLLSAMFLYIAGYQVCFGPITWCIVSETFPMEIRSKAIALCVELNYALNFIVQFIFPTLKEKLGWGRTFFVFSTFLMTAIFYVRIFVPETAGLTLEEIETKLSATTASTASTAKEDEDDDINRDLNKHNNNKRHYYHAASIIPTEDTHLLARVDSSTFLGAYPNLEEMETQIIRKSSPAHAIDDFS